MSYQLYGLVVSCRAALRFGSRYLNLHSFTRGGGAFRLMVFLPCLGGTRPGVINTDYRTDRVQNVLGYQGLRLPFVLSLFDREAIITSTSINSHSEPHSLSSVRTTNNGSRSASLDIGSPVAFPGVTTS